MGIVQAHRFIGSGIVGWKDMGIGWLGAHHEEFHRVGLQAGSVESAADEFLDWEFVGW